MLIKLSTVWYNNIGIQLYTYVCWSVNKISIVKCGTCLSINYYVTVYCMVVIYVESD